MGRFTKKNHWMGVDFSFFGNDDLGFTTMDEYLVKSDIIPQVDFIVKRFELFKERVNK